MRTKPNGFPLLLLALVGGGWSLAHAADPPSGAYKDCSKIGDYRAMVDCVAQNTSASEAELTRIYDTLLQRLSGSLRRDLLASSQAAWTAYRSAYCALVSSAVEGGSFQPTVRAGCYGEITRLRIKELEVQLNCTEGDTSCIAPNRRP